MAKKIKGELKGKARIRAEIVEGSRALHKVGAISTAELGKTTLRMLGPKAARELDAMTPREIVAVREKEKVSQGVMAAFLNVAVKTISQWERGERKPTGAALKLLHVVKQKGIEALQ